MSYQVETDLAGWPKCLDSDAREWLEAATNAVLEGNVGMELHKIVWILKGYHVPAEVKAAAGDPPESWARETSTDVLYVAVDRALRWNNGVQLYTRPGRYIRVPHNEHGGNASRVHRIIEAARYEAADFRAVLVARVVELVKPMKRAELSELAAFYRICQTMPLARIRTALKRRAQNR